MTCQKEVEFKQAHYMYTSFSVIPVIKQKKKTQSIDLKIFQQLLQLFFLSHLTPLTTNIMFQCQNNDILDISNACQFFYCIQYLHLQTNHQTLKIRSASYCSHFYLKEFSRETTQLNTCWSYGNRKLTGAVTL